jgi:transposase-like protein
VHGRWKYLYRAIDRDGALVDVMLSEHRNLAAAKRFFQSAKAVTGVIPDRVTTDGHDAYPRAIRLELGSCAWHRTNSYLNLRSRSRMCQHVPAATRRFHYMRRTAIALGMLEAA